MDKDYEEISEFLRSKIPMTFDLGKMDLIYDETNMYFKACKYLYKLKQENDKLKGKKK